MLYLDLKHCTWQNNGFARMHKVISELPMLKEVDVRLLKRNKVRSYIRELPMLKEVAVRLLKRNNKITVCRYKSAK